MAFCYGFRRKNIPVWNDTNTKYWLTIVVVAPAILLPKEEEEESQPLYKDRWPMDCKYANVLLAGAGFSHGFGFPLASELKDLVFSSRLDGKGGRRVKEALEDRISKDASLDKIITELDSLMDLGDMGARHLLRIIRG